MMDRRGRAQIYGDITRAIEDEIGKSGEAMLTRVQSTANIPYSRFKDYVGELEEKGMVQLHEESNHVRIELTELGRSYLKEYEQLRTVLRSFRLETVPDS